MHQVLSVAAWQKPVRKDPQCNPIKEFFFFDFSLQMLLISVGKNKWCLLLLNKVSLRILFLSAVILIKGFNAY